MKKVLVIGLLLLFIACTKNQECREKSFKKHQWTNGSSTNLTFGDDDTMRFDMPSMNIYGLTAHYVFDEDCEGYTVKYNIGNTTTHYYKILTISENTIVVKVDNSSSNITYTKQ